MKFAEISDLNNDQVRIIRDNGWCIFTEHDECGSYYQKGLHIVNRIGYVVFDTEPNCDYINSYEELGKMATEDRNFILEVASKIDPYRDVCYGFLIEDYNNNICKIDHIWTNKDEKEAKRLLKARYSSGKLKLTRVTDRNRDRLESLVKEHNKERERAKKDAIALLEQNGYKVIGTLDVVKVNSNAEKDVNANHPIKIYDYLYSRGIYIDNFYPHNAELYTGIMMGMVACRKLTRAEYHNLMAYIKKSVVEDEEFRKSGRGIPMNVDYQRAYKILDKYMEV